ncbi:MAG: hypothetical protein ACR2FG_14725 [Marmoricola sp.]
MADETARETGPGDVLPPEGSVVDRVVSAIDDVVPVRESLGNRALPDTSRAMPWIGVLFAGCALALVPWLVYLGFELPERQLAHHYDLAWAGFDTFLFAALACTAYAVLRRSPWVGMSAGAAASLLVTDAWFDVVTAPDLAERVKAVAMAALMELPLTLVCLWLCAHAADLAEKRIRILVGREKKNRS